MAIYALEDVDTFTFRVFGRLLVSFQGITPDRDFLKNWGATEFEDSTAKGVAFLGRLGTESAKPIAAETNIVFLVTATLLVLTPKPSHQTVLSDR